MLRLALITRHMQKYDLILNNSGNPMESEMKFNSFTFILISDFYRLTSDQNEPCH